MANLERLFKDAQTKFQGTTILKETKTQEVLRLVVGLPKPQGIAWRPLSGIETIQIYPPTNGCVPSRDGDYFVLRKKEKVWRYHDPEGKLNHRQWSYVGCRDCTSLPNKMVLDWITQAYNQLKQYKGVCPL
jgi:hypothetical protein